MIFIAYTTPVSFFFALTTFRHKWMILDDKTIFIQEKLSASKGWKNKTIFIQTNRTIDAFQNDNSKQKQVGRKGGISWESEAKKMFS